MATGDFNEDGKLDVVATGSQQPNTSVYWLSVLLGNGQGLFTRQGSADVSEPGQIVQIRVGDVNADGHADLAFLDFSPSVTPTNSIHTALHGRLGDGQGSFSSAPDVALPSFAQATALKLNMHLADFNNDGRLDVLFDDLITGQATYLGNGQGGFAAAATAAPGPVAAVAELTGDGILDAVCTTAGNTWSVYAGTGQGGFSPTAVQVLPAPAGLTGILQPGIQAADLDLLTAESGNRAGGSGYQTAVRVWHNDGSGAFAPGTSLTGMTGELTTGDVNNDGTLDVAVIDRRGDSSGLYVGVQLNSALSTAPTISSFTPITGATGTILTLSGSNFTEVTSVLLGGVAVGGFTVVSATTITLTVPAGSMGGLLTVTTPTGTATSTTALTLAASPIITSFTPATAPASAPVTVTGAYLLGATSVTVGGVPVTGFTVSPSGNLTFTLPAGSVGGAITVTTPGGSVTSATTLTLVPAPIITAFTPAMAPASAPVTVAVTGTNLTGATAVTVGSVAITGFTVNAAGTVLTFTLPAGAAGGSIAITTPEGTISSATALTIVLSTRPVAALSVQLYPNPAHGTVYVRRPDGAATPLHAALYNSLGQLVRAATLPAPAPALEVGGLPAGIYSLRLTAGANGETHRLTVE